MDASTRRMICRLAGAIALATVLTTSSASAQLFQEVPGAFTPAVDCVDGDWVGCETWYVRAVDIDGDSDLDVLFPTRSGQLLVYVNDGQGNFTDNTAAAIGVTSSSIQIAVEDIDGDGDLDIYKPPLSDDPAKLFINDGQGIFVDEIDSRLPGHAGYDQNSPVRFGDLDGDGDLDLVVTTKGNTSNPTVRLFANDGSGHFTASDEELPARNANDIDLVDVDRDFDLDLVLNLHTVSFDHVLLLVYLNDGTGAFAPMNGSFVAPNSIGAHYGPVACDVDADGDLDIWIDNMASLFVADGDEALWINDGNGNFTDQTAARVSGNVSNDDNGLACVDYDGDGDLDAAIMALHGTLRVLENDGTGNFTYVPGVFSEATRNDNTLTFDFGDMNGDGRLDCASGQGEGGTHTNRLFLGTAAAPVDVIPPKIIAVQETALPADAGTEVRFAVSESATTDGGPRLQQAVVRVTEGNDRSDVAARFMGGDLFRAVVPPPRDPAAVVAYVVCATDQQGNEGCTGDGGAGGVGGGGGGGGDGGAGAATGAGGAGASTGATAAGGAPATSASGTGAGGVAGTPGDGDDDGCGCAVPGAPGPDGRLVALVAACLLAGVRRARRAYC